MAEDTNLCRVVLPNYDTLQEQLFFRLNILGEDSILDHSASKNLNYLGHPGLFLYICLWTQYYWNTAALPQVSRSAINIE